MRDEQFIKAYVACALWSSIGEGEPMDANYDSDDIHPETMALMEADCRDFLASFGNLVDLSGLTPEQAGHDFWLTRNGHGAGFWDRGLGEIGDELTKMTKPYGSFDLYIGDDGLIHGQ